MPKITPRTFQDRLPRSVGMGLYGEKIATLIYDRLQNGEFSVFVLDRSRQIAIYLRLVRGRHVVHVGGQEAFRHLGIPAGTTDHIGSSDDTEPLGELPTYLDGVAATVYEETPDYYILYSKGRRNYVCVE